MSLEELRKGGYLMDETQWLRVRVLYALPYPATGPTDWCPPRRIAHPLPREHRGCAWNGGSRAASPP